MRTVDDEMRACNGMLASTSITTSSYGCGVRLRMAIAMLMLKSASSDDDELCDDDDEEVDDDEELYEDEEELDELLDSTSRLRSSGGLKNKLKQFSITLFSNRNSFFLPLNEINSDEDKIDNAKSEKRRKHSPQSSAAN